MSSRNDTHGDAHDHDGTLIELGYDRLSARSRWELLAYAALISVLAIIAGFLGAMFGIGVVLTRLFLPVAYAFAIGQAGVIAVIPPTTGLSQLLLVEAAFFVLLGVAAVDQPLGREIAIGTLGGGLTLLWPLQHAATSYPLWVLALSLLGGFAVLLYALFQYDLVGMSTRLHEPARASHARVRQWLAENWAGNHSS